MFPPFKKFDMFDLKGKTLKFAVSQDVSREGVYDLLIGEDVETGQIYVVAEREEKQNVTN